MAEKSSVSNTNSIQCRSHRQTRETRLHRRGASGRRVGRCELAAYGGCDGWPAGAGGAGGDELPSGADAREDERAARQQVRAAVLRGARQRSSEALPAAARHVRRRAAQRGADARLGVLRLAAPADARTAVQLYGRARRTTVVRRLPAAARRTATLSEVLCTSTSHTHR